MVSTSNRTQSAAQMVGASSLGRIGNSASDVAVRIARDEQRIREEALRICANGEESIDTVVERARAYADFILNG